MDLTFLNEKTTAILMVILGVIALAFPLISSETVGIILGVSVLLLALGLLISGIAEMKVSKFLGVLSVIFAIICMIISYELIFDVGFLSLVLSFIIYLIGFLLIVMGIIALLNGSVFAPFSIIGISTIIFGIITLFVGVFVGDPAILGTIIGIWLIVSGLLLLFTDKNKSYITVNI